MTRFLSYCIRLWHDNGILWYSYVGNTKPNTKDIQGLWIMKHASLFSIKHVEQAPDVLAIQKTWLYTEEHVDEPLKTFVFTHDVAVSHAVGTLAGCLIFLSNGLNVCNPLC